MRQEMLTSILDEFNAKSTDIFVSVVMSIDGVTMALASTRPEYPDEDKISALCACILHLGAKIVEDFAGGGLEQVLVKGRIGYLLAIPTHQEEIGLIALTSTNAELELIFSEMKQAAESIGHVIRDQAVEIHSPPGASS
jgi:predicted regulator of Ras-like GTPase activity (Roadblock/LC7/MglB family)